MPAVKGAIRPSICSNRELHARRVTPSGITNAKGSSRNEISFPLMCTPSAELEDPLDAARVGLFHLRLQLCTETVLVYAQQKTEVEKLNAFGRERFLQLRPGCQAAPVSPE